MEWIGCVRCEKSRCDFMARTFALIAPVHTVLHQVSSSDEMIPNASKHYAMHENMSLGPMGWIGCVHYEKSWCDFVAGAFALIAPIHPILHRVSCSYETIPIARKYYETHQNISFGSNGVDLVRSLRKMPMWLRGTKFCINYTSSPCSASIFIELRNDPKRTQILCIATKH